MIHLYLLRHGETEENVKHILQGHLPGTLTELGRSQAREAARKVAALDVDIVLCSDLKRCFDTYDIIKEEIPTLPDMLATSLLRERGWGSATGMVADGVTRIVIPKNAESISALKARAKSFLDYIKDNFPDRRVLAISHGLICRVIQGVHFNKDIADIERMKNAEIREIIL